MRFTLWSMPHSLWSGFRLFNLTVISPASLWNRPRLIILVGVVVSAPINPTAFTSELCQNKNDRWFDEGMKASQLRWAEPQPATITHGDVLLSY